MQIKWYVVIVIALTLLAGCSNAEPDIASTPAPAASVSQSADIVTPSSEAQENNPWENAEAILEFSSDEKDLSLLVEVAFSCIMEDRYSQADYEITGAELFGTTNEFAAELTFTVPGDDKTFGAAGERISSGEVACIQGIRVKKIDETQYAVIGFGNGAIALGLDRCSLKP